MNKKALLMVAEYKMDFKNGKVISSWVNEKAIKEMVKKGVRVEFKK
jgi:hypothetical protein